MIKAIVTDIEGTTTSVTFVYDVLFSYARKHLASYLSEHSEDEDLIRELEAINREVGRQLDMQQAISQLIAWMDEDKKVTPLKSIQGMIWEEGYRLEAFKGHIYRDVPPKLEEWKQSGKSLYVYSSGSIKAQKLLFSHTKYGDLTRYFTDFFDTNTGQKRETGSYQRIAETIGIDAGTILFLSDVIQELDAATRAGFQVVLVDRDGTTGCCPYTIVQNFNDIHPS